MNLETLDVRVHRLHRLGEGKSVKAFVDLSVNNALLLSGIRIVEGRDGLFVSMPREQGKDQKWYDKIRFTEKSIKEHVCHTVLEAYHQSGQ